MLHAGAWARRYAAAAAVQFSVPQTNLIEDWNAQVPGTLTIDSTLATYSGLNPIPTLSGTVPQLPYWLGVRTGGVLGAGLYSFSYDGGSNFWVQNEALPGSGTRNITLPPNIGGGTLTVNFPAGTYTTGATYVSRVLTWVGTKGAFTWVQDAGQPASGDRGPILTARGQINNGLNRLGRGIMGRLGVATGSNGYLISTTGNFANALGGGTNKPFHVFMVASFDAGVATSNQQVLMGLARNASNPRITMVDNLGNGAANGGYTTARINDAASNANQFISGGSAPAGETTHIAFVLEIEFDGTNTTYRRSTAAGTTVIAGPTNNSGGTFTLTQAVLFALKRTTLTNNAAASCCRVLAYSAVQTGATLTAIRNTLVAQHDIAARKRINNAMTGASLTAAGRGGLSWSNLMMFGNDFATNSNFATAGWSTSDMVANLPALNATFDGTADDNFAWFWAEGPTLGINGGPGNLALAQSDTATWCASVNGVGWKSFVKTVIPGGTNPAFEANRLAYNAWLRTGASGATVIDDQAARWPGTPGDNIWYDIGDDLHTGFQGASWIAGSITVGGSEQLYRAFSFAA